MKNYFEFWEDNAGNVFFCVNSGSKYRMLAYPVTEDESITIIRESIKDNGSVSYFKNEVRNNSCDEYASPHELYQEIVEGQSSLFADESGFYTKYIGASAVRILNPIINGDARDYSEYFVEWENKDNAI